MWGGGDGSSGVEGRERGLAQRGERRGSQSQARESKVIRKALREDLEERESDCREG